MSLASLYKLNQSKVLGIDASTHTIAYCLFDGKTPIEWGEINFDGGNIYERILDAKKKIKAIKHRFSCDFVAIEAAVSVKSIHTGIKMAYVFGAIMGELLDSKKTVLEVHPITWQSYIGNKNFNKLEKESVKLSFPEKSDNWHKGKIREMRKQKTIEFAKSIGVDVESDNVADACGIAWYAVNNMVRK